MKQKEIEKHKIAVKKLELVKDKAFEFIKRNLDKISEYDVCKFVLSEFKKQELISDKKPLVQIVAVNENPSIVHYYPKKENSEIIKKESLILIDLWARLKENRSPFADITWMAFVGKNIPKEYQKIFRIVIKARNLALDFIKKEKFEKEKIPKNKSCR